MNKKKESKERKPKKKQKEGKPKENKEEREVGVMKNMDANERFIFIVL